MLLGHTGAWSPETGDGSQRVFLFECAVATGVSRDDTSNKRHTGTRGSTREGEVTSNDQTTTVKGGGQGEGETVGKGSYGEERGGTHSKRSFSKKFLAYKLNTNN